VKDTDNNQLVVIFVDHINDDVGRTDNHPFVGAGDATGVADEREARQSRDVVKNSVDDAVGSERQGRSVRCWTSPDAD
jgi:hypothetical protein